MWHRRGVIGAVRAGPWAGTGPLRSHRGRGADAALAGRACGPGRKGDRRCGRVAELAGAARGHRRGRSAGGPGGRLVSVRIGGGDEELWGLTALAAGELRPVAEALVDSPGVRRWWEPVDLAGQRFVEWDGQPCLTGPALEHAVRECMAAGRKRRRAPQAPAQLAARCQDRRLLVVAAGIRGSGVDYDRGRRAACGWVV